MFATLCLNCLNPIPHADPSDPLGSMDCTDCPHCWDHKCGARQLQLGTPCVRDEHAGYWIDLGGEA